MHEKSVSQNIQNIFFVLKIRKQIFLTAGAAGGGGGGGGAGAGAGAYLTAITVVTSSQRFA